MKKKNSLFAISLRRLLDSTNYYTRAEWARFLGVSTPAISQWVNDKTLPRPDLIRMIVDVLRKTACKETADIISEFEGLGDLPSKEISPLGSRFEPSLNEYLKEGSFFRFGQQLRGLSPQEQISMIETGGFAGSVAQPEKTENPVLVTLGEQIEAILDTINSKETLRSDVSELLMQNSTVLRRGLFPYRDRIEKKKSVFREVIATNAIEHAQRLSTANETLEYLGIPALRVRTKLRAVGQKIQQESSRSIVVRPAQNREVCNHDG